MLISFMQKQVARKCLILETINEAQVKWMLADLACSVAEFIMIMH